MFSMPSAQAVLPMVGMWNWTRRRTVLVELVACHLSGSRREGKESQDCWI